MQVRGYFGEGQIIAPPRVEARALPGTGFVVCPPGLRDGSQEGCGLEEIYRMAYERARAALRPSWYVQLSRACPN